MTTPSEIPSGLAHLSMLSRLNTENRAVSEELLKNKEADLQILGESMAALYLTATCHRKCWGGDHILEALAARIYNLACASYSLVSVGFYDEALSLVRSIGEIANLLSLSVHDKPKFVDWIRSSKQERIREFSPARVRKLVKKSGLVLMDENWYSELCESYSHVTPTTKPNRFNEDDRSVCGGVVQERGVQEVIEQLTSLVSMVALFYCRYFELDDYFERIVQEARIERDGNGS